MKTNRWWLGGAAACADQRSADVSCRDQTGLRCREGRGGPGGGGVCSCRVPGSPSSPRPRWRSAEAHHSRLRPSHLSSHLTSPQPPQVATAPPRAPSIPRGRSPQPPQVATAPPRAPSIPRGRSLYPRHEVAVSPSGFMTGNFGWRSSFHTRWSLQQSRPAGEANSNRISVIIQPLRCVANPIEFASTPINDRSLVGRQQQITCSEV